jgi:hypothetical protein
MHIANPMTSVVSCVFSITARKVHSSEGPDQSKLLSILWDWLHKVLAPLPYKYLMTTRRQYSLQLIQLKWYLTWIYFLFFWIWILS